MQPNKKLLPSLPNSLRLLMLTKPTIEIEMSEGEREQLARKIGIKTENLIGPTISVPNPFYREDIAKPKPKSDESYNHNALMDAYEAHMRDSAKPAMSPLCDDSALGKAHREDITQNKRPAPCDTESLGKAHREDITQNKRPAPCDTESLERAYRGDITKPKNPATILRLDQLNDNSSLRPNDNALDSHSLSGEQATPNLQNHQQTPVQQLTQQLSRMSLNQEEQKSPYR